MSATARERRIAAAAWAVALAAAGLLFLYVFVYRINGAEWDHLSSTNVFYWWDTHQFTSKTLFQQHNEHRIAVPRLAILGLGLLTRWNNVPEMFAHAGLMCLTAAILFGAFRRDLFASAAPRAAAPSLGSALFAFVPAALTALSPRSYEALTGFGFPHYLEILFYVAGLRLLVFDTGWLALAGAILCGEGATFSVANGLWLWPFGLAAILSRLRTDDARSRTLVRAAVWAIAAAATIAFYFHNYLPTGNHPAPSFFVEHPLLGLVHFLVLNGTVFATTVRDAAAFGTVALLLYLWVCALVVRDWWRAGKRPPFGFWLIASVLASNATVTAGRAIWGPIQALDSRYAAQIALAPIGLYWCLVVRRGTWRVAPVMTRVAAALLIAGYAIVTLDTWARAPESYSRKKEMAYLLYTMPNQPDSLILKLSPIVSEARWFGSQLERMRLNVFADPHLRAEDLTPTMVRPPLRVETINGRPRTHDTIVVGSADPVEVRGYAMNAAGNGPARAMFLTIDGRTDLPAVTGLYRPGTKWDARWTGFDGSFAGFVLTPGQHTLSLKVVADDGRHAYVTDPIGSIVRR